MTCKCGNTLFNVPEHLVGLAEFICHNCTAKDHTEATMAFLRAEKRERERQKAIHPLRGAVTPFIEPRRESLPTRDPRNGRHNL